MDELADLRARLAALEDERAIIRLQTAYGYYVDKGEWDEAADLFAPDATLEIAARGLFVGQDRIRAYLHALPAPQPGTLFNHMQLQPLVSASGDQAHARWRAIMQVGFDGRQQLSGDAVYENAYVRHQGVWKIARLHAFITHYVDWMSGEAVPMGRELPQMAPDAPQTVAYASFPGIFTPPYHYPNPVTGRAWQPRNPA